MTAHPQTMSRLAKLGDLRLDHVNWANIRTMTGLDEQSLSELGSDIKERGILVPPRVQRVLVNGAVQDLVIDGQRRVRSALGVLSKTALIEVIDRTAEPIELTREQADQITLEALAISERREGLSSYEISEVAETLRNRDHTMAAIAKAVGKSESWVSKILKARLAASPKLMLQWKKGELTDEQFKDLAAVKDPEKQSEELEAVQEAKKSGNAAEARTRAKEAKARVQKADDEKKPPVPAAKANGKNGRAPVVTGDQVEMWSKPPEVKKKTSPSKLALEQMLELAGTRPPTHDYVKGIMDAVRYALDETAIEKFGKPWLQYVSRATGQPMPKKAKAKKGKPSKPVKAAKARKPKPAKKGKR